jgi:heme exporter protein A
MTAAFTAAAFFALWCRAMSAALAATPSSAPDEPLLAVHGLACARGGRRVLSDVGFTLGPGELILITGPNGSGKTSLLRCIAGLLAPDAGTVAGPARARGQTLHVGHADPVKPHLTVLENLRFWAALGAGGGRPPEEAADAMGLAARLDVPARILSAGQRRRLSLARLLLSPALVWLLDEPANALDTDGVARLAAIVADHRARGGAVIVATHGPLPFPDARPLVLGHGAVAC